MFKRFLLVASVVLAVLSGPPSRVLAEGDHPQAATAGVPVVTGETSKDGFNHGAESGNQEQ
jgi:hypothetical protein